MDTKEFWVRDGDGRSSLQNLEPLHVLRPRYLQAKTLYLHPHAPNSRWRRCNQRQRSHASAHGRLETSRGRPQGLSGKRHACVHRAFCIWSHKSQLIDNIFFASPHARSHSSSASYASSCKAVALETKLVHRADQSGKACRQACDPNPASPCPHGCGLGALVPPPLDVIDLQAFDPLEPSHSCMHDFTANT